MFWRKITIFIEILLPEDQIMSPRVFSEMIEIKVKRKHNQETAIRKIQTLLGEVQNIGDDKTYDLHIYNIQRNPEWLKYINQFTTNNIGKLYFITSDTNRRQESVHTALKRCSREYRILRSKAQSAHQITQPLPEGSDTSDDPLEEI